MKKILLILLLAPLISYSQDDTTDLIIRPNLESIQIEDGGYKKIREKISDSLVSSPLSSFRLSDILLEKIIPKWIEPEKEAPKMNELNDSEIKMLEADVEFISDLPKSYEELPKKDLKNILVKIDSKIIELKKELENLIKARNTKKELIETKKGTLKSLEKEKNIINLTLSSDELKDKNGNLSNQNDALKLEQDKLKKYLYISFGILALFGLIIAVIIQRKRINVQDVEIEKQLEEINKKNSYIEHAARIIRHDMHSGINTYIPRGISSLEKRLTPEDIEKLKIETSLKMVKEGLSHTQRVYKSVYEFTNLVKQNVVLNKEKFDIKDLISKYISSNTYSSQVTISDLGELEVNQILFCSAIENLIKNGLTYNDSTDKKVNIYMQDDNLIVEDNGRGFTQKQLESHLKKYSSSKDISGEEKGLGLNICLAILEEHGFKLTCEKIETGTKIKIKIN